MSVLTCCLIIVPLLAFLFELTKMLKEKRKAESGGVHRKNSNSIEVNGYFAVLAVAVFSTVIYAGLETAIAINRFGFAAPENLKLAYAIAFICNAAFCVFKGIICVRGIGKGVLSDGGDVTKCVLKAMAFDIPAVAVFAYFLLAAAGIM